MVDWGSFTGDFERLVAVGMAGGWGEGGGRPFNLFFVYSLMYFNSKLTGTAQETDNIKNIRACRTTQKSIVNGWNLL